MLSATGEIYSSLSALPPNKATSKGPSQIANQNVDERQLMTSDTSPADADSTSASHAVTTAELRRLAADFEAKCMAHMAWLSDVEAELEDIKQEKACIDMAQDAMVLAPAPLAHNSALNTGPTPLPYKQARRPMQVICRAA